MVSRVFLNSRSKAFSALVIVSLDEVKSSQDHEDVGVRRLQLVSFHEGDLDRFKVFKVNLGDFRELTVIGMRLEPVLEATLSFFLVKLVGAADS